VHVYDGRAEFRCSSFAWGVCLDLTGEQWLDDNFFDIYPGMPHVIPWDGTAEPEVRFIGNAGMSDFSPPSHQSLSQCQNVTLRDGSSGP
jgi:hypothetical protein